MNKLTSSLIAAAALSLAQGCTQENSTYNCNIDKQAEHLNSNTVVKNICNKFKSSMVSCFSVPKGANDNDFQVTDMSCNDTTAMSKIDNIFDNADYAYYVQ